MSSQRLLISNTLVAALRSAADMVGAQILDNPTEAQGLAKGDRVVWIEDQVDDPIEQAGQQGKRRFTFALGVINRTSDDRAGADADHQAALSAITKAHTALMRDHRCGPLREGQTVFRVEGLDIGGALILTTYTVEYLRPRPSA